MAALVIPKNYEDDAALFESDIDDIRSSLLEFFNTIRVTNVNINDNALSNSNLADNSITIQELNTDVADGLTIELDSSNGLQIADDGIETVKIIDSTVTRAKQESANFSKSSSSGSFKVFESSGWTNVSNLSISFTATGRPLLIGLIPDGSSSNCYIGMFEDDFSVVDNTVTDFRFRLVKDGSQHGNYLQYYDTPAADPSFDENLEQGAPKLPPGWFRFIDKPASGTYLYQVQVNNQSTSPDIDKQRLAVINCKLVILEL